MNYPHNYTLNTSNNLLRTNCLQIVKLSKKATLWFYRLISMTYPRELTIYWNSQVFKNLYYVFFFYRITKTIIACSTVVPFVGLWGLSLQQFVPTQSVSLVKDLLGVLQVWHLKQQQNAINKYKSFIIYLL